MSTITLIEIKDIKEESKKGRTGTQYFGVTKGRYTTFTPFHNDDFYAHAYGGYVVHPEEIDILFRLPKVGEVIDQETRA